MTHEEIEQKLSLFWKTVNGGTATQEALTNEIVAAIFNGDRPDVEFPAQAMRVALFNKVSPVVKALAEYGVALNSSHLYAAAISLDMDLVRFMIEKDVTAPRELRKNLLEIAKSAAENGDAEKAGKAREMVALVKTARPELLSDHMLRSAAENAIISRGQ